nr:MAG TPA: hypothetical protein [Caudoviricetes sp.]
MATFFCTLMLTLHKSVLYASNHGYVHPNETDSEPCQPAGFLLFWGKITRYNKLSQIRRYQLWKINH